MIVSVTHLLLLLLLACIIVALVWGTLYLAIVNNLFVCLADISTPTERRHCFCITVVVYALCRGGAQKATILAHIRRRALRSAASRAMR